jgi:hypothetical protein
MRLFNYILPIFVLFLLSETVVFPAFANALNFNILDRILYYEYTLDESEHIGYMPTVDIELVDQNNTPVINGKICGQWYINGQIAPAPNADIPQSYYCRDTDENGYTFFAYRYRYFDYSEANIQFKILSLEDETVSLYPDTFISFSF